jgi:DNA-binding transcriptional ArsR family regulator
LYLSIDFINQIAYYRIMDGFTAVADPTRRKIVETLALQGRLSATQISGQFSISAQAISQHLKILREAKILHMDKRAQQRLYRINPESMLEIEAWAHQITQLWQARFDAIAALLEEEDGPANPQENQPS